MVLRVLTRQDFSGALRVALVHALSAAVDWLEAHHPLPAEGEGDEGAKAQAAAQAAATKVLEKAPPAGAHQAHAHAATLPARLLAATRLGLPLNRRGKC